MPTAVFKVFFQLVFLQETAVFSKFKLVNPFQLIQNLTLEKRAKPLCIEKDHISSIPALLRSSF
jgi:hypothetical protein